MSKPKHKVTFLYTLYRHHSGILSCTAVAKFQEPAHSAHSGEGRYCKCRFFIRSFLFEYNTRLLSQSLKVTAALTISVILQCFYRVTLCVSAVFAVARCLSVRLSVTLVHCIQTAEDIVKLLCRRGSPVILVFDLQR